MQHARHDRDSTDAIQTQNRAWKSKGKTSDDTSMTRHAKVAWALILRKSQASSVTCRVANASGSTQAADNIWSVPSYVLSGLWSQTSPKIIPSFSSCDSTFTMPHTLLVSFSLLALVVTARPIVPVSYVLNYDLCRPLRSYVSF